MSTTRDPLPEDNDKKHRQTTRAQKISKAIYSCLVDGVFLSTVIACEFIPPIPQPYKEIMKGGLILANINAADALRALTERKYPFAVFNHFTWVKHLLAPCPPMITCVAFGFLIQRYGGVDTPDNILNETGVGNATGVGQQILSALIHNPLAHMGILAGVVYAESEFTKKLIDGCVKPTKINEESEQHILQILLKTGIDVIEPIALYETLRIVLLQTGQENVLHGRYLPLLVIGFDQLLKLWGHMSRIPMPLHSLVGTEKVRDLDDGELGEMTVNFDNRSDSNIAIASSYYLVRAGVAISLGGMLTWEITNLLRDQTDQEQLDSQNRLLNLLYIAGATGMVEKAFDATSAAGRFVWSKLSDCRQTLFRAYRQSDVDEFVNPQAPDSDFIEQPLTNTLTTLQ